MSATSVSVPNGSRLSQEQRDQIVLDHLSLVKAIAIRVHESLPVHVDLDDMIHAGVMGRGPVPAAGRQQLVPALGDGMGARWRCAVAAVRRRPYRGGDQAGLSRDPRGPRTHAVDSVAGAGAGAVVDGDKG